MCAISSTEVPRFGRPVRAREESRGGADRRRDPLHRVRGGQEEGCGLVLRRLSGHVLPGHCRFLSEKEAANSTVSVLLLSPKYG